MSRKQKPVTNNTPQKAHTAPADAEASSQVVAAQPQSSPSPVNKESSGLFNWKICLVGIAAILLIIGVAFWKRIFFYYSIFSDPDNYFFEVVDNDTHYDYYIYYDGKIETRFADNDQTDESLYYNAIVGQLSPVQVVHWRSTIEKVNDDLYNSDNIGFQDVSQTIYAWTWNDNSIELNSDNFVNISPAANELRQLWSNLAATFPSLPQPDESENYYYASDSWYNNHTGRPLASFQYIRLVDDFQQYEGTLPDVENYVYIFYSDGVIAKWDIDNGGIHVIGYLDDEELSSFQSLTVAFDDPGQVIGDGASLDLEAMADTLQVNINKGREDIAVLQDIGGTWSWRATDPVGEQILTIFRQKMQELGQPEIVIALAGPRQEIINRWGERQELVYPAVSRAEATALADSALTPVVNRVPANVLQQLEHDRGGSYKYIIWQDEITNFYHLFYEPTQALIYSYTNNQEDMINDKQKLANILLSNDYVIDKRSSRAFGSLDLYSDFPRLVHFDIYSNGQNMVGIANTSDELMVVKLGAVAQIEQLEQKQSTMITNSSLFSSLVKLNVPWIVGVGESYLAWHQTQEDFEHATSLEFRGDNSQRIFFEIEDEKQAQTIVDKVRDTLSANGYRLDHEREWVNTSCGGTSPLVEIYTDGNQVVELSYSTEEFNEEYSTYSLDVSIIASVERLQEIEQKNALASMVYDAAKSLREQSDTNWTWAQNGRRFTVQDQIHNPYSADERYEVVYDTHCGDFLSYYYKVSPEGKITVLAEVQDCESWQTNALLDAADRQFLYEHHCSP